jgi:hypothetical protein
MKALRRKRCQDETNFLTINRKEEESPSSFLKVSTPFHSPFYNIFLITEDYGVLMVLENDAVLGYAVLSSKVNLALFL